MRCTLVGGGGDVPPKFYDHLGIARSPLSVPLSARPKYVNKLQNLPAGLFGHDLAGYE